jgi:hypothetical protein
LREECRPSRGSPPDHPEGAKGEALDQDLHPEELDVPAGVAHERVDDHMEVVVDLVALGELLREVAVERLEVPPLVHDLGAPVELAVEPLDRGGELGRREERALLAVEELITRSTRPSPRAKIARRGRRAGWRGSAAGGTVVARRGHVNPNLGRNDPCHCGSGKKYKQCCLARDEAAARVARAKAAAEAPLPAAEEAAPSAPPPKQRTRQPWKRTATNTHGFQKTSLPRKVGGG